MNSQPAGKAAFIPPMPKAPVVSIPHIRAANFLVRPHCLVPVALSSSPSLAAGTVAWFWIFYKIRSDYAHFMGHHAWEH